MEEEEEEMVEEKEEEVVVHVYKWRKSACNIPNKGREAEQWRSP